MSLFDPITLGGCTLNNRMVMAPMTRSRSDDATGVPLPIVAEYYAQRASAGLIISETIFVDPMGKGYVRTPGLCTAAQIDGWREVTNAVHAKGGKIFAQLYHAGRVCHPSMLPGRAQPVAPSAIKAEGMSWTNEGQQPFVEPRALTTSEIGQIVAQFGRAAEMAISAGFDGVELHAASGYLVEQFLCSGSNTRDDLYGGSADNRTRFAVEAAKAMVAAVGARRVGVKISPEMGFNDCRDANPVETYSRLVEQLSPLGLAYLHVALFGQPSADYHTVLRSKFNGPYLMGSGQTKESATAALAAKKADAVVFGALFLANPDLVARFKADAPLNAPDPQTFYSPDAKGYTDYPTLAA